MNVVHFAEGFFFHTKGVACRVGDPQTAQRCYHLAIEKFEEALDSNPNNKVNQICLTSFEEIH